MKWISKTFVKGLIAILPIAVTIFILSWLVSVVGSALGKVLQLVIPPSWYWPGMGIAAGLLLVFIFGLMLNTYVANMVFARIERALQRIPMVKVLYGAVHDMLGFFASYEKKPFSQVVLIRPFQADIRMVGLVTREDLDTFPAELGGKDLIAVYVPLSYQVGGHTMLVPRDIVKPISMSMEQALRFVMTAGLSKLENHSSLVEKSD